MPPSGGNRAGGDLYGASWLESSPQKEQGRLDFEIEEKGLGGRAPYFCIRCCLETGASVRDCVRFSVCLLAGGNNKKDAGKEQSSGNGSVSETREACLVSRP